jgi:hypothetical protein
MLDVSTWNPAEGVFNPDPRLSKYKKMKMKIL